MSFFDDPNIDEPKHCGNKKTWCYPNHVEHCVSHPNYDIIMPWPQSLHIYVPYAHCGCLCEDCLPFRDLWDEHYPAAIRKAYAAFQAGTPIIDPKCQLCIITERKKKEHASCGPERTLTKRRPSLFKNR